MTWERFSYICRKASVSWQSEEPIASRIERIEKEAGSNLYGQRILTHSWHRKLLNEIGAIANKEEAKRILKIYGKLRIAHRVDEPLQFRRVTAYLAWIVVIFLIVSGIYQLKVAPAFLEVFENLETSIPSHLLFYKAYGTFFFAVIFGLMLFSLIVGSQLASLCRLPYRAEESFVVRYLAFGDIKASYRNLLTLLQYPLLSLGHVQTCSNSDLAKQLGEIEKCGLNLVDELQLLIDIETRKLVDACESQMKIISVLIALMVLAAIFFFLASAYSPIFILGETV